MSFEQQLLLNIISDLVFAGFLVVAGYLFDRMLQNRKARDEALKELSSRRVLAFEELWKLTSVTATDGELEEEARVNLDGELRAWYFDKAGAMFLTWPTADKYLRAVDVLRRPQSSREDVKEAFSSLRTELKVDTGIYRPDERSKQLFNPRKPLPSRQEGP